MDNSIYWTIDKSLSYQALYNFIVGARGTGKTYALKKYAIKKFLKTGKQFIYIRRYKKEFSRIKNFFSDISGEFPENKLEYKKGVFYIDECEAGYTIALSTAKIEKSVAFPDVDLIIFDEFILDKGTYHYLPDEVTNFLECYETIARMRDVQVYFLSNALTITNPYFLYFNIQLPYGKNIMCKKDILIEMVAPENFKETKKETRFAKIIEGTQYSAYAIDNEFLRDTKTFIEKKTGNCTNIFNFIYQGLTFGVWRSFEQGKIWVSKDHDENMITYALSKADHTPNTLLLNALKQSKNFKAFIENYKMGNVYYESVNIKNVCYEVVKLAQIY